MEIEQILLISERQVNEYEANFKRKWLSQGVTDDEEDEIKTRFKYVYTNRVETYTYFKLKSGRYSMIKTLCREDEYIVNGFIFDYIDMYPYEIINSPDFKDEMVDKEKPPVLDRIRKGSNRPTSEVMKFISSKGEKTLEQIINSIINLGNSGEGLKIIDKSENFIFWITAIDSVFPVVTASKITFTSYDYQSLDKEFTIGFKGVKEQELKGYYFDFAGGIKAYSQREYKYAQIASTGFFKAKNIINGLHRFLNQFTCEDFGEELDYGCTLFTIFNFPAIKPSKDDITNGLMFLSKYCSDETREMIIERHGGALENMVKEINNASSQLLIEFIISTLEKIKSYTVYERAVKIFYDTLDMMTFNLEVAPDELYRFYAKGEEENRDKPAFYKYQISGSRIELINNLSLTKNTIQIYEFCIYTVVNSFVKLGYSWEQAINFKGFQIFMDSAVKEVTASRESIGFLLDSFKENQEFLLRLEILIFNRMESDTYTELLAEKILESLSEAEGNDDLKLRRELYKLGGGNILLKEFELKLEKAEDKKGYFMDYLENIFSPIPEYYNKYYDRALLCYLDSLQGKEAFDEIINFLKDVDTRKADLDRDSLKGIIALFEKNLQIKELDEYRDVIKNTSRLKRTWDIKTYPDITYLVELLYYIEEDEDINVIELIEDVKFHISGVPQEFVAEYLNLLFFGVLSHVKSKEEHREIVNFIFMDDAENKILYYFETIVNLFNNNRIRGYMPLIHFIAYYFFYVEPFHRGKDDGIVEYIDRRLREIFEIENKDFLEKVNSDMKEEFEGKGFSIPLKWIEMYKIEAEGKTFKGKIKNLFGRK